MPIPDLVLAYQTKTDEELLQLGGCPEQLTPEARAALGSELAKHRIDRRTHRNAHEENGQSKHSQQRGSTTPLLRESPSVGEFLRRFSAFFTATSGISSSSRPQLSWRVTLQSLWVATRDRRLQATFPAALNFLGHQTETLEIWFASFVGYFVSWVAFCFSFGAARFITVWPCATCPHLGQLQSWSSGVPQ